jgi:DNA phosphorothioation-dependent restriction protein DptG
MSTFKVDILRTGYSIKSIEVDAETKEEANEKALKQAGNHEFSEDNSEYTLADAASSDDRLRDLLRTMRHIEKALRDGQTTEQDGDVVKAVREREGDYLTMLTDLGAMAAKAIKDVKQ